MSGSPRSPRIGKGSEDHNAEILQPGTLKVSVQYSETGDSQVLYFPSSSSTVEELKRQVMEYAEHGVSSKINAMILLLDDGTSLVKTNALLSSLPSLTVYMFSRDTLMKTYNPTVALEDFKELEYGGEADPELKKELCERCLSRCRVQIEAGTVALRNLEEHAKTASPSLARFKSTFYEPYLEKAQILSTFDQDMEKLSQVQLARPLHRLTAAAGDKKTMLDALPKEKIRKWAEEATRQHEIVEGKYLELISLARGIDDGCETVREEWAATSSKNLATAETLSKTLASQPLQLDAIINQLKQFKSTTTTSLFPNLLRSVSSLQFRIQDLNNRMAALKEALVVQEQKISQISVIRSLPDAYQAALKEAERRRQFVDAYSKKITQVSDFIAKERDKELAKREQFYRQYGKILPQELVPGLNPWVFPACEVTQRQIDPVLIANKLEYSSNDDSSQSASVESIKEGGDASLQGELLFGADSGGLDRELSAMEILELQAENELLRNQSTGKSESTALSKLKEQYEKDTERLRQRIVELEKRLDDESMRASALPNEYRKSPSEVATTSGGRGVDIGGGGGGASSKETLEEEEESGTTTTTPSPVITAVSTPDVDDSPASGDEHTQSEEIGSNPRSDGTEPSPPSSLTSNDSIQPPPPPPERSASSASSAKNESIGKEHQQTTTTNEEATENEQQTSEVEQVVPETEEDNVKSGVESNTPVVVVEGFEEDSKQQQQDEEESVGNEDHQNKNESVQEDEPAVADKEASTAEEKTIVKDLVGETQNAVVKEESTEKEEDDDGGGGVKEPEAGESHVEEGPMAATTATDVDQVVNELIEDVE